MTFKPAHLLVVLLAAAIPAMAQTSTKAAKADAGPSIAVVNGTKIPTSKFENYLNQAKAQGQQDTPQLRAAIKDRLVAAEVLIQEATKSGIDKKDDIKLQIEATRQQVLINALLREYIAKNPLTDAEIKDFYEKAKLQEGETQYHAYHILVEKEDEAKAIISKLKSGAKFDELAKQSKDPGSAAKGGDLDWAAPATFVPAFATALTGLKKGQFTETPVKTEFGYHVIKLEDTRPTKFPALEEVKQQIVENLGQQKVQAYQQSLIAKAKIQ